MRRQRLGRPHMRQRYGLDRPAAAHGQEERRSDCRCNGSRLRCRSTAESGQCNLGHRAAHPHLVCCCAMSDAAAPLGGGAKRCAATAASSTSEERFSSMDGRMLRFLPPAAAQQACWHAHVDSSQAVGRAAARERELLAAAAISTCAAMPPNVTLAISSKSDVRSPRKPGPIVRVAAGRATPLACARSSSCSASSSWGVNRTREVVAAHQPLDCCPDAAATAASAAADAPEETNAGLPASRTASHRSAKHSTRFDQAMHSSASGLGAAA